MGLMGLGLLLVGIVALVYLFPQFVSAASGGSYVSAVPSAVDFPAPPVRLNDLQGNPVALDGFSGKYVLVNHWATWCPPCKAEMPVLNQYYQKYKDQNFIIVAIESGEPADEVAAYAREHGLAFPVWPDPSKAALAAFNEEYLPSSYLLAPDGRVVMYWSGPISMQMLETHVTPLFEE